MKARAAYYSSSSSVSSSEDESSCPSSTSSTHLQNYNPRNVILSVNFKVFGKSKSMSYGEGKFKQGNSKNNNKKKNVGGFLSKILRGGKNDLHEKHVFHNNNKTVDLPA